MLDNPIRPQLFQPPLVFAICFLLLSFTLICLDAVGFTAWSSSWRLFIYIWVLYANESNWKFGHRTDHYTAYIQYWPHIDPPVEAWYRTTFKEPCGFSMCCTVWNNFLSNHFRPWLDLLIVSNSFVFGFSPPIMVFKQESIQAH